MDNLSWAAWGMDKAAAVFIIACLCVSLNRRGDAFRLKLTAILLGATMGLFLLLRGLLYVCLPDFFSACGGWYAVRAFARGLVFDLSATAVCAGLFILLVNLPVRCLKYYRVCMAVAGGVWALALLLGAGDIVYFLFVKRHAGMELVLMAADLNLVAELAFSHYAWALAGWLLCALGAVWGGWKLWGVGSRPKPCGWKHETVCLLLVVFVLFFAFRGRFGFRFKPLAIQDAYADGRLECGHLALNSVFNAYKSLSKKYAPVSTKIPAQEAVARAGVLLSSAQQSVPNAYYPLLRSRHTFNIEGKGKNVVVLLLESWQKEYTDALAGTSYGATENLDRLIKQGLSFTRFYASGQRSINGAGTIMTGVPQLPGLPYYSLGLESYPITGLAGLLKKEGYRTVFAQPSPWNSARIGLVAEIAGFEEQYTYENISSDKNYVTAGAVSDYEALMYLADKLEADKNRPFFAFFFSAAMHPPYKPPRPGFDKYPWNGTDKGYLNALYYTDWAIGEFMARLKQSGLAEDTVFILLADHTLGWGENGSFDARFNIPFVVYAPSLIQSGVHAEVASQTDVFPTVLDILNVSAPYAALGNSVFDPFALRFAYTSMDGRVLGWKTDKGLIEYTGQTRVTEKSSSADFNVKQEEIDLLSLTRASHDLLRSGRWAPAVSPVR